jgi:hypothetical protein
MPFPKNYEILPGRERHNYETNPTEIISFGDIQLETKFEHRSCVGMIFTDSVSPIVLFTTLYINPMVLNFLQ